jgi:hypothetical protein
MAPPNQVNSALKLPHNEKGHKGPPFLQARAVYKLFIGHQTGDHSPALQAQPFFKRFYTQAGTPGDQEDSDGEVA